MSDRERPRRPRRFRVWLLLTLLVGGWLLFRSGAAEGPVVADGSTLVIEVSGQYVEAASPSLIARVLGDDGKPFLSLLSVFGLAERDDRIATVVVHIRDLSIGWGKATELRSAIARLNNAGRKTIAHIQLDGISANHAYYIATAADEIYLVPGAVMPVVGLSASYLYFGDMWEQFGIEVEASKAGKYKSAVETLTESEMSDETREMMTALLDAANNRFVAAIAQGRGLTELQVAALVDEGLVTNAALEARGLIDGVAHLDELPGVAAVPIHARDYRLIDPRSVGFDPKQKIALIYGSGAVVSGSAGRSTSGGPVFAADRIRDSLLDAADNPEVSGIVLRVDSPGGSPLASEVVWHAIKKVRAKGVPVVVSVSDVAASGAYYVASAADAIIIPKGGITGSIGVFAIRPSFGGLLDKLGIEIESMRRGRHSDFFAMTKPMSDGTRVRMQELTREIYDLFMVRVAEGRGLEAAQVRVIAEGRVWSAEEALEIGLVDELGGMREAVSWILRDQGLDENADVELIDYPEPPSISKEVADLLQSGTLSRLHAGGSLLTPLLNAAALNSLPVPRSLLALHGWIIDLPSGGPLLVPPVFMEIR